MYETHRIQKITVVSLCEHSGLSRKTFYRLFESKDDVLIALIDHTFLDYESFTCPVPNNSNSAHYELVRFFSYWYHCRPLLDALSSNRCSTLLLERCLIHVFQVSPNIANIIGYNSQPNSSQTVLFNLCGIIGVIIDWHHKGYDRSVDEMAETMYHLLTHPPIRTGEQ